MISESDIRTLFGSVLERIGNADLRAKVVKTWLLEIGRAHV